MTHIKVLPRMKDGDIDLSELFSTMDSVKGTEQLAQSILTNTEGEAFVDKWFPKAELHLLTAIIAYIYEKAPVDEQNTYTIKCFLLSAEPHIEGDSTTAVDLLFDDLEDKCNNDFAVMHYKTFRLYMEPSVLHMVFASCISHIENLTVDDIPWPECMRFQIELKKVSEWYERNRSFFLPNLSDERPVDEPFIHADSEEVSEEFSDFITALKSRSKPESESESESECSVHRQVAFLTDMFYLDRETCHAKAIRIAKKIVILKGSLIDKEIKASMPESSKKLRSENARKIDRHGILKEDVIASSASEAAGFVTGMNTNGKIEWRTADGRSLGDLVQAEKDAESVKKGSVCIDGQKNISEDIKNETKLEEETEHEAEEQTIAEDFDGLVTPDVSKAEGTSAGQSENDKADSTHGFGNI